MTEKSGSYIESAKGKKIWFVGEELDLHVSWILDVS